MRVRYSPRSIEALDDIRHLERWPYQGRATEQENVRRIVVTNYPYVYYHVNDERVLILTVMHSAQDR